MADRGLGLALTSWAYSAYNFWQPGVNGYDRYKWGADPTDHVVWCKLSRGNAGTARTFF